MNGIGWGGCTSLDTSRSSVGVENFETMQDFAGNHQIWLRLDWSVEIWPNVEEIVVDLDEILSDLSEISVDLEENRPNLDEILPDLD